MARYSLRNKHKIEKAYSAKFLKRIIESLDEAFNMNGLDIEDSNPFPILIINDKGHTCGFVVLHVINQTFDVYNLAFKEIIN